jgi:hypothetical protein
MAVISTGLPPLLRAQGLDRIDPGRPDGMVARAQPGDRKKSRPRGPKATPLSESLLDCNPSFCCGFFVL